jgi:dolichol-phosphate mannosyltransferase
MADATGPSAAVGQADPEVTIIVPVFNEADNVAPLFAEITQAMKPVTSRYELVFVDDGSTDDTWQAIGQAHQQDPRVRGLRHARNAGQSAAVWTGLRASRSPVIATLDGDLQNDPADLPRLLAKLAEADLVSGVRVHRHDNWVRQVSSVIARKVRNAALGVDFQDTGCGLRAFKREVLTGVFGFNGLHRWLPVIAAGAGFRALELPVSHRPRVAGVSKYGVWNRLWRGLYDLMAIAWYLRRRLRPVPYTEWPEKPAQPES